MGKKLTVTVGIIAVVVVIILALVGTGVLGPINLQEMTLIVLFVGLAITIIQLQRVIKGQRLHSFNTLLDIWGKTEERAARRYVIMKYSDESKLPNGDRQKVETVLAMFNRIGFVVAKKLVPKKDVMEFFGYSTKRCWDKLEKYVLAGRKERNNNSHMCFFEYLAKEAKKWSEKEEKKGKKTYWW